MWSAVVPALASTYNNTKEIHEAAQTMPEEQRNNQHNLVASVSVVLHPSQNVRRLNFSQKSISSKFDQVYTKKCEYLQYQMDILRKYNF
jgi:hypothetical protein